MASKRVSKMASSSGMGQESLPIVEPVKVGVIGCGTISGIYFKTAQSLRILDVVACADLSMERARERAEEFDIPHVYTVEELLADPQIELVLNLTIPAAHFDVARAALEAGKSVYSEKPLAIRREDGQQLVALAKAQGLYLGGAPDTFLGAGLQTCRKLVDDGWIGEPVAATAFMLSHGPESWHPNSEFYYQRGGGPLFDMGPYYLTALISLLGPVRRVTGSARTTFETRTVTSEERYGAIIPVETPTHIAAVLDFANGAVVTLITSFDVWAASLPPIEVYGTRGSLHAPDPNRFGGAVSVRRAGVKEWSEVPLTHHYDENSRGIGLAEMAYAMRAKRQQRASGALTYHVLDIMHAIEEASEMGKHIEITSTCERPRALPLGLLPEETLQM